MKTRWITLAFAALIPIVAATAGAFAQDGDTPTIKDVMGKLHKGANAPFNTLKTQVKGEKPDWDQIQKTTKDFVILGASLAKNDPPKGDKEDWKKAAGKYFANAKALDDAASAKDLEKMRAAVKAVGASCKSCHDAHKGK